MNSDLLIITAAFNKIKELELLFGDTIPSKAIRSGVELNGESIFMENQAKGIFKPRQMKCGALSIKTTMRRDGGEHIYNDQLADDGYYHYSLQSGDPKAGGNKLLWQSLELQQPFIYFCAVAPAVYKALWPCFIKDIFPEKGYSTVFVGKVNYTDSKTEIDFIIPDEIESRYIIRETNVRLHQASFRHNVLEAYQNKCALSGLPVPKLIEAAHIIPDSAIGTRQTVSNGIALSRIHHKAYDSNILGIDPDFKIHLGRELLPIAKQEVIAKYFGSYKGAEINVPTNKQLKPDRDYLARRFEIFERANFS